MANKKEKIEFTNSVLNYYDQNKRNLPWRDVYNPYYTWLSEIMLQQTRVDTVIDYFNRFIQALPDVESLANCNDDYLMKLWQGLGYYSRARNLKKAAQQIMEEYQGIIPTTKKELLNLAGIGNYTAAAIASISFGRKEVALDGNLIRVFSRVFADDSDFSKQSAKNELENKIIEYLPVEQAGDFNQAIMDIGATICLPNGKPLCGKCPISKWCKAYQKGEELSFPTKKIKKARKKEKHTIFIFQYGKKILLQKRNQKGVLFGLWEFPNVPEHLNKKEAKEFIQDQYLDSHLEMKKIENFLPSNHIFSHLEWDMISYWVTIEDGKDKVAESNGIYTLSRLPKALNEKKKIKNEDMEIWASKAEIMNKLSLPTAFKTYEQAVFQRL